MVDCKVSLDIFWIWKLYNYVWYFGMLLCVYVDFFINDELNVILFVIICFVNSKDGIVNFLIY